MTVSTDEDDNTMQFRGGMSELMRQASRIQRKVEQTKKDLKDTTIELSGANEKVKVAVNYAHEILRVTIDPEFLASERELALYALMATINAALKMATEALDKEIEKVTGGIKIPGIT